MSAANAERISSFGIYKVRLEVIVKEPLLDIAQLEIAIAIFGLDTRLGTEYVLHEDVDIAVFLSRIGPPTICIEIGIAGAE